MSDIELEGEIHAEIDTFISCNGEAPVRINAGYMAALRISECPSSIMTTRGVKIITPIGWLRVKVVATMDSDSWAVSGLG
jgi:hypothetical protein